MMRRLSYIFVLVLLVASCAKDGREVPQEWDGPVIELNIVSDGMDYTKATMDGVDEYNENLIDKVDLYFYPNGDTESPATYHVALQDLNKRRSAALRLEVTTDIINTYIFPSADNIRSCTVFAVVNWPEDVLEDDLSKTSLLQLRQKVTTADFRGDPAITDFQKQDNFLMSGLVGISLRGRTQTVAATGTIPVYRYACKLTVGVNVADEVVKGNDTWIPILTSMQVYLENGINSVNLSGELPNPQTSNYFSYKKKPMKFTWKDDKGDIHYYFEKIGDYYQTFPMYMYPQHWEYGSAEAPTTEPYLKLVVPWVKKGADASTQRQFYYKIVMPDDSREEYRCSFARNNWYHININVSILGSETDEASVPVSGWCYVFDWQDKDVIVKHAQVGNARYLSVDRLHYDLYNISSKVFFSYVTSHPIDIKDIRATRPYYGTEASGTNTLGGTVMVAGDNDSHGYKKGTKYLNYTLEQRKTITGSTDDWIKDSASMIKFLHPLINDYKDPLFDYSPYTISYTIYQKDRPDDTDYQRTQTVVQYPGIYIESTPNPDKVTNDNPYWDINYNDKGSKIKPDHWGYVYVNSQYQYTRKGRTRTIAGQEVFVNGYEEDIAEAKQQPGYNETTFKNNHVWRVIHYSTGGTDMYKVNVTVLPKVEAGEDEFVIGDPRQKSPDQGIKTNLSSYADDQYFPSIAPSVTYDEASKEYVFGADRCIQNYYPTEASERTENMVAPSFRISTKLSGTEYDGTGLEQARYRCASFQENGYPAGRWRLPTLGEIKFVSQLSANNVFEWQFGGNYWSANGAVNVSVADKTVKPSTKTVCLVRCVYDSWYWGEARVVNENDIVDGEPMPSLFVWADAER